MSRMWEVDPETKAKVRPLSCYLAKFSLLSDLLLTLPGIPAPNSSFNTPKSMEMTDVAIVAPLPLNG